MEMKTERNGMKVGLWPAVSKLHLPKRVISMEVKKNRYVSIRHPIDGTPSIEDFEVREHSIVLAVEEDSKEIIVKNLYLSIDVYQLNRMKSHSSSQDAHENASGIIPGQVIQAFGIGRVVVSGDSQYQEGDLVMGLFSWQEYSIIIATNILTKINSTKFPLSYYLSVFGTSGLTAYFGLHDVCKPKKGESVFVSSALGSVGNLVGQLAKLHGCYVVGCAGSNHKVQMLKEELGFDDAFNYKEETDLHSVLKRYLPNGIDIYFDNVGGKMLEAAMANLNAFGRVAACGIISEYVNPANRGALNMVDVIYKRIKIQGFASLDYIDEYDNLVFKLSEYIRDGSIRVLEDISSGIESIPSAFVQIFLGQNIGKKMVKL